MTLLSARVRRNAAIRHAERLLAATQAHDAGGVMATCSPALEVIHHPTGLVLGASELVAGLRPLFAVGNVVFGQELLASLGESLALVLRTISQEDVESGVLVLLEVDGDGRQVRSEVFEAAGLDAAIGRLYERHAELLPSDAARSIAAKVARPDLDRNPSALSPDVELAGDVTARVDEILALEPDALLLRWTVVGTDRATRASFLRLWQFDAEGLVARDETFDVDRVAEALVRFDELRATD